VCAHRVIRRFGGPEGDASPDTATDTTVRVSRTRKGADGGGTAEMEYRTTYDYLRERA
jgi:hypothetical protein